MPIYIAITIIISLVGVIVSVISSTLIVGVKWGKMETKIDTLTRDVSQIMGMFTLTLKKPDPNALC